MGRVVDSDKTEGEGVYIHVKYILKWNTMARMEHESALLWSGSADAINIAPTFFAERPSAQVSPLIS